MLKLSVKNFRSIKSQEIELAPITILYGPNGAGKSSLLYSLLTLKNFILNPNQSENTLFNYGSINLGGFESVIFAHDSEQELELNLKLTDLPEIEYGFRLGNRELTLSLQTGRGIFDSPTKFEVKGSLPFRPYRSQSQTVQIEGNDYSVDWNGVYLSGMGGQAEHRKHFTRLQHDFARPNDILLNTIAVSTQRGFTKPQYVPVQITPQGALSEDEIATLLSTDKYLIKTVSDCLKQICGRELRSNVQFGTVQFSLDVIDNDTGLIVDVANDGYGIGQIIIMLTQALIDNNRLICIDEPEVHLHPTSVRALAESFVKIVREKNKMFLLSTHSEILVSSLLALVAEAKLKPTDINCFLVHKEGLETQFLKQAINEKGQIEGGLREFAEAELQNLQSLLGIKDE